MAHARSFLPVAVFAVVGLVAAKPGGALLSDRPRQEVRDTRVPAGGGNSHAMWLRTYETPTEMATDVDLVATGTVLRVAKGRVVTTHRGEARLEFELVTIQVSEVLKSALVAAGDVAVGEVTIERLATNTLGTDTVNPDFEGGPFEIGGRHVLFLHRQKAEPFKYVLATGEGRFALSEGDTMVASVRGAAADTLHGKPLSVLRGLLPAR